MTTSNFIYALDGEVQAGTATLATEAIVFKDSEGQTLEFAGVSGDGETLIVQLTNKEV